MALPSERANDLRSAYRICEVTPLEGEDLRHTNLKNDGD
jgi:hypothetical protein